jgi:hypothetical protein
MATALKRIFFKAFLLVETISYRMDEARAEYALKYDVASMGRKGSGSFLKKRTKNFCLRRA